MFFRDIVHGGYPRGTSFRCSHPLGEEGLFLVVLTKFLTRLTNLAWPVLTLAQVIPHHGIPFERKD